MHWVSWVPACLPRCLQVLPLPDGVVIGRCNLQQVAAEATAAMQQALQEAATKLTGTSSTSSSSSSQAGRGSLGSQQVLGTSATDADGQQQQGLDSSGSRSGDSLASSSEDGDAAIASLNTVGERGVALQVITTHGSLFMPGPPCMSYVWMMRQRC
jgi:hypothetical protein